MPIEFSSDLTPDTQPQRDPTEDNSTWWDYTGAPVMHAAGYVFGAPARSVQTGASYLLQQLRSENEARTAREAGIKDASYTDFLQAVVDPSVAQPIYANLYPEEALKEKRRLDDLYNRGFKPGLSETLFSDYGAKSLIADIATDPLTYVGGGLTKVGKARMAELPEVAMKAEQAFQKGGTAAAEAARTEALAAAAAKTGMRIPEEIGPGWTGVERTLGARMRAGESGLQSHLPLIGEPINAVLEPVNKLLAPVVERTIDPIVEFLGPLGETWAGKKAASVLNVFKERSPLEAGGLVEEIGARKERAVIADLVRAVNLPELNNSLQELSKRTGLSMRDLTKMVSDVEETTKMWDFGHMVDGVKVGKTIERTAADRTPEMQKTYDKVMEQVQKLNNADKEYLYNTVNAHMDAAREGIMGVSRKYGLDVDQMGKGFYENIQRIEPKVAEAEAKVAAIEGKIASIDKQLKDDGGLVPATTAGAGGLGTPPLSASPAVLRHQRLNLLQEKMALQEQRLNAISAFDNLKSELDTSRQHLTATPVWVPRQSASDVEMIEGASKPAGGYMNSGASRTTNKDIGRLQVRLGADGKLEYSATTSPIKELENKLVRQKNKLSGINSTYDQMVAELKPELINRRGVTDPDSALGKLDALAIKRKEAEAELNSIMDKLNEAKSVDKGGEWTDISEVPLLRDTMEEYIRTEGISKLGFAEPKKVLNMGKAAKVGFENAKQAFLNGAKMSEKGAIEAAKEASDFFTADLPQAIAAKFSGIARDARMKNVEEHLISISRSIRTSDWDNIASMAADKSSWSEIADKFKKKTGYDLKDFMPEGFENTKPSEFSFTNGPRGYSSTKSPPSGMSAFQHGDKSYFIPEDWMKEYDKYRKAGSVNLGGTAGAAWRAWTGMVREWKGLQIGLWPDYNLRNLLTDTMRMQQEGLISRFTPADFTALSKAYYANSAWSKGWRDFSKAADIMAPGLDMNMAQVLEKAKNQGILGNNFTNQVTIDAEISAMKRAGMNEGAIETAKRMAASRDEIAKVSAFMEGLRQGETEFNAATRANKALFDYTNNSDFVNFARRSGLSPFLSFAAKNVPAQLKIMIEAPAQFSAMLHIQRQINNGSLIPDQALPQYAKNKFNLKVNVTKDDNGKPQLEYVTLSGVIPQSDIIDLANSPTEYILGQAGPIMSTFYDIKDQYSKPEDQRTKSTLGIVAESVGGKPLRFAKYATGMGEPTAAEKNYFARYGKQMPHGQGILGYLGDVAGKFVMPAEVKKLEGASAFEKAETTIRMPLAKAKREIDNMRKELNSIRVSGDQQAASKYQLKLEQKVRELQELHKKTMENVRKLRIEKRISFAPSPK